MKLLRNSGNERVVDCLRDWLAPGAAVDLMSPAFSLYAFAEARDLLAKAGRCRVLLGEETSLPGALFGGDADIAARGRLQGRWLAKAAAPNGSRRTLKFAMRRRCRPNRWSSFRQKQASAP